MHCHATGGIAPFPLDDYDQAKSFATLIEHVTRERIMPPWSVTSDGSCGEFKDSEALSEAEIQLIARWVQAGGVLLGFGYLRFQGAGVAIAGRVPGDDPRLGRQMLCHLQPGRRAGAYAVQQHHCRSRAAYPQGLLTTC